jgi:hypothetical protein
LFAAGAAVAFEFDSTPASALSGAAGLDPCSAIGVVAVPAFASVFAAGASSAGAGSVDSSTVVLKTELPPVKAGIEIINAENIKTTAAAIVILARTEAVPRGPNAVFEILLVNKAPASVFPG